MGSGKGQSKRVSSTTEHHLLDKEIYYKINNTDVTIDYTIQGEVGSINVTSYKIGVTGLLRKDENKRWELYEPQMHLNNPGQKQEVIRFDNVDKLFLAAEKWATGALYPEVYLDGDKNDFIYWEMDADHHLRIHLCIGADDDEDGESDAYLGEMDVKEFKDMAKALVALKKSILELPLNENLPQKPINYDISF